MPTSSKIASDARSGASARIGRIADLPAGGTVPWLEVGREGKARLWIVAPPAGVAGHVHVSRPALVDERLPDGAGSRVHVLVRAPDGEVHAPVVQPERHVPRRVRQVPADHAAHVAARGRDALDVQALPGEVLEAGQPDQRELRALVRDPRFHVLRAQGRLAGSGGSTRRIAWAGLMPRPRRWEAMAYRSDGKAPASMRTR